MFTRWRGMRTSTFLAVVYSRHAELKKRYQRPGIFRPNAGVECLNKQPACGDRSLIAETERENERQQQRSQQGARAGLVSRGSLAEGLSISTEQCTARSVANSHWSRVEGQVFTRASNAGECEPFSPHTYIRAYIQTNMNVCMHTHIHTHI